jgi:hypothetical protein
LGDLIGTAGGSVNGSGDVDSSGGLIDGSSIDGGANSSGGVIDSAVGSINGSADSSSGNLIDGGLGGSSSSLSGGSLVDNELVSNGLIDGSVLRPNRPESLPAVTLQPHVITQLPKTPSKPCSCIQHGQDEIFRHWATGSYNSSPVGHSPTHWECIYKNAEDLGLLECPTPFLISNKDCYCKIHNHKICLHAAQRAATVGRIIEDFV